MKTVAGEERDQLPKHLEKQVMLTRFSFPLSISFFFSPSLGKEKAPGDNYESRYPWKPLCLMVNEAETYRLRRRIGSDKSAGKWLPAGD